MSALFLYFELRVLFEILIHEGHFQLIIGLHNFYPTLVVVQSIVMSMTICFCFCVCLCFCLSTRILTTYLNLSLLCFVAIGQSFFGSFVNHYVMYFQFCA